MANLRRKLTVYKAFFSYRNLEFCKSNQTITANIILQIIQETVYRFPFFEDFSEISNALNIFTELWA